jgi:hypothetical protein
MMVPGCVLRADMVLCGRSVVWINHGWHGGAAGSEEVEE